MKSTLTRCELRITKTMSSTSTSAATMALAPRFDSGEAEDPGEPPGTGLLPEAGVLRPASGQPALMRESLDPGALRGVTSARPAVLGEW